MIPTLPVERFHHYWERFDYYHPSFSPSALSPHPASGPTGASAVAATAARPAIGPSQAAVENAAHWRAYHRSFGRCDRPWRGPSRFVWVRSFLCPSLFPHPTADRVCSYLFQFGIGSLITYAVVKHKTSSSGSASSHTARWPLTDGRPPFFTRLDDGSRLPSAMGSPPAVTLATPSAAGPETLVAPIPVVATVPVAADSASAAPAQSDAQDRPHRRFSSWSLDARRERHRSREAAQVSSDEESPHLQQQQVTPAMSHEAEDKVRFGSHTPPSNFHEG